MNKNYWEEHLYFGKLSKTPEMNMSCFIICKFHPNSSFTLLAAEMLIKVHKASLPQKTTASDIPSPKEVKISQKFKKYLTRMSEVIDGNCKKIPNTPVNFVLFIDVLGKYA